MEDNLFDLSEFSKKEINSENSEGNSSSIKENGPFISSFNNNSSISDFSLEKQEMSPGQITISQNNSINSSLNNPINIISNPNFNKSYNDENLQICEQNINLDNPQEKNKNSLKDSAIEDNIDISKFDEIKEPAMKFSFTLDDFQKRSIIRLEENKNILVCAHTSSGKTLVAEYGIALGKKNKKKVIYTSPIKALSNQKYRDFKKKFGDVGIITGDVNINPDAQCLIITTEILHKFLYNQSNTLNNVGTVIFDEVHYINDNERGHIWEEILIILPSYISIIMLSATIPNYYEFACWVGKIKNTKVYIEVTKNRVIPLQQFIYIDSENVFQIKNKENIINDKEINNAFSYLKKITSPKNNPNSKLDLNLKKNNSENNEIKSNSDNEYEANKEEPLSSNSEMDENEGNEINDDENEEECNEIWDSNSFKKEEKIKKKTTRKKILEITKYLLNNKLFPSTLFVFNIRKIEDYSNMLIENNNIPELPKEEKGKINNFFNKIISMIPENEKKIKQINYIKQILQYGIGVHHSGLLPILKEIIEILYFHGLIKILFATTSFSIGLNMPTKTVVFTSLKKYHEGKSQMLNSSEFLQMCGRAGRRGIDKFGNIYILIVHPQGKKEIERFKNILKGQGNDLESKFRLSYRIILSFYYRNLKNIKDFLKESFHESHNIEKKPERLNEIKTLETYIKKKNRIKCVKNKKKKENIENEECIYDEIFCDIEDSPIAKLISNTDNYDLINKNIFNNDKIIEYLDTNPGTILKMKIKNNTTINKFHKYDMFMLVNMVGFKKTKKLWCITITAHEDNKNNNSNCSSNSKKEDNQKEEEKNQQKLMKKKGTIKEYKYKYALLNLNDIIEIYEKPKVTGMEKFYKSERINNYFDITEKGYYYFKNNNKALYSALVLFYRAIINNFPKKANDIQLRKSNKNKKNNQSAELKTVKFLNYKKLIDPQNQDGDLFAKKNKLLKEIKNNNCQNCSHYNIHLNIYKEICDKKERIKFIKSEIAKGEKEETFKMFNTRLEILKQLKYIQNDDNEIKENPIHNIDNLEEQKYNKYSLTLKGKASLEIITNDSILISEFLFSNIFIRNEKVLPNEIIVAFLASFVDNSKIRDLKTVIELEDKKNNDEIKYLMGEFHKIYKNLSDIEKKYELEESVYNRSFSFKHFYSVYSWMKGENFCDVCTKCQTIEGKLHNTIMRTFYFVEEIIHFYKKIGNEEMVHTFSNIKKNLLKGIMSVESLYLKDNINIDNI